MKELLERVEGLRKTKIRETVDRRMKEFEALGSKPGEELFKELCFCILTANSNARQCIKIQKDIGDGFLTLPEYHLAKRLKELGHRFPSARAGYITGARKQMNSIHHAISHSTDEQKLREWLVGNIKGFGYKEASHFLRNIGFKNLAIVDFHIMDLLARYGLFNGARTLGRGRYLKVEGILTDISRALNMNLAELDLYLWYMETGRVLK